MIRHPDSLPEPLLNLLLQRLITIAEEIAMGRGGHADEIFEMTKSGQYPEDIARFAEAFGMMLVQVESREYHLEQVIAELRVTCAELGEARELLAHENRNLRQNLRRTFPFSAIMGASRPMKEVVTTAAKLANSHLPLLITGETGVGKELFAKAIHYNSRRGAGPFVAVNCSAIQESLFESEMFGIEKGVATGVTERLGKLEQASGGTLFLDELGEMPVFLQAKLLRALEERSIERVGGRKTIPLDLRIIAATNRDLRQESGEGRFREDLYYRIKGVELRIPPLRERPDDVELLARHFVEKWAQACNRPGLRLAVETVELLRRHHWPGNVRELEHEVERAVALACGEVLLPGDFSECVRSVGGVTMGVKCSANQSSERDTIETVLRNTGGNRTEAARRLGLSREGLRKKMLRLGM